MSQSQDLSAFGIENRSYSIEEWLAIEARTGEKFEYHEGRLVHWQMMAGATPSHALIANNFGGALFKAFTLDEARYAACHTYGSDLQIKVGGAERYVYPDATIVCGPPEYDPRVSTAIINPLVVAEVLSPSSFRYDTSEKFDYYARLDSLREYVLIAQDQPLVEVRTRREAGGPWYIAFAKTIDAGVELPALGLKLPMAGIYRGIAFEDDEASGVMA